MPELPPVTRATWEEAEHTGQSGREGASRSATAAAARWERGKLTASRRIHPAHLARQCIRLEGRLHRHSENPRDKGVLIPLRLLLPCVLVRVCGLAEMCVCG
jgi:hypothetical protein